jgi:hypothetical protein
MILSGGKDVIFSFMQNQSTNWSLLILKTSHKFFEKQKWGKNTADSVAIVADDTLKERFGKKVEGTSLHWNHNKMTSIKGQQYLHWAYPINLDFFP